MTTYLEVGLETGFLVNSWGTFTVRVRERFDDVKISYRTFIHCPVIGTHPDPLLIDYFKGDGRWFHATAGTARSTQIATACVDALFPTGQVSPPTQFFGTTIGYDNAVSYFSCQGLLINPPAYCNWTLHPNPIVLCTATAQSGVGGNLLQMTHSRVGPNEVKIDVTLSGADPCSFKAPAIDATFTIRFRQFCEDAKVLPMEYKIDEGGVHDGFPWHELYLNNQRIYKYDPCTEGTGPFALGPPAEVLINNPPQLLQWRQVPGQ